MDKLKETEQNNEPVLENASGYKQHIRSLNEYINILKMERDEARGELEEYCAECEYPSALDIAHDEVKRLRVLARLISQWVSVARPEWGEAPWAEELAKMEKEAGVKLDSNSVEQSRSVQKKAP